MEFSIGIMLILLGVLTLTGMRGVIGEAASLIQPSRRGPPNQRGHVHTYGGKTPLVWLDGRFGRLMVYQ
jgi:hypothetical protein